VTINEVVVYVTVTKLPEIVVVSVTGQRLVIVEITPVTTVSVAPGAVDVTSTYVGT